MEKETDVTRNLPSLRSIATDPGVLTGLPLDALDALLSEAEAENKIISAAKRAMNSEIERRYGAQIAAAYGAKGADFGTVHVLDGGFDIEINTPKRVEWSEDQLAAAGDRIAAAGDDPHEYLTVSYSIDERKYSAWPEHIRRVFEPARTVRPGSRSLKLSRSKKEAA